MFTEAHLIEEYHLPTKPELLKGRLKDIIKAHKRMFANSSNMLIKEKVKFLEEWEARVTIPTKALPTSTRKKK